MRLMFTPLGLRWMKSASISKPPKRSGAVAAAALYHDAPEIFTGDLPTPVKYANSAIRDAYKAVEQSAADRLSAMLPPSLRPSFDPILWETDPQVLALVKGAAEAHKGTCRAENRSGGGVRFTIELPALHSRT